MELWIKTNSKIGFGLVKVNDIVLYSREGMYALESKDFVLGMYDTKERAIEVLDEIEKILHPFVYLDNCIITGSSNGMIYRDKKTNQLIEFSTYVYEMPEE